MSGTLFGVGMGPGDPELVTVKAARIIGLLLGIAVSLLALVQVTRPPT